MNLLKTTTILISFVVIAIMLLPTSEALARETSCEYHAESGYLVYSVTDGDPEEYIVKDSSSGCTNVGSPPGLTGPADIDSVQVECLNPGLGEVSIQICNQENVCFVIYNFRFRCDNACNIEEITGQVPGLSYWGIIALIVILGATTVAIIRRKKAHAA